MKAIELLVTLAMFQTPPSREDVVVLARTAPEAALVSEVRLRPDDTRDALRRLLASTMDSGPAAFRAAERLAVAWHTAWHDSFFVRQVARFGSLSPGQQRLRVSADSLRLEGNTALGASGIDAAMRAWRSSLGRCDAVSDTACMAAALANIGGGFYRAQALDSAEYYLSRARSFAEQAGDHRTEGNALGTLGVLSRDRGDLRRASDLLARARPVRERTGDARGLAADQQNLGLIARSLGDLGGARRAFQSALVANRAAGRLEPAATNLINLGNVASLEGDFREAAQHYREALAIHRERGNRTEEAAALHNLGLLAMRRGDYRDAIATLGEAAAQYRRTGQRVSELQVRRSLAASRSAMGDVQGARAELRRAETAAAGLSPDAGPRGSTLAALAVAQGDLALELNQLAEAERHYARAGRLARAGRDQDQQAAAQQGMGIVLLRRQHYRLSGAALELAARTQLSTGDRRGAAQSMLLAGYAAGQRGDSAEARRVLSGVLHEMRSAGDVHGRATVLGALAELDLEAGLPIAAESLYRRGLELLRDHPAPAVSWPLHAGLARALISRGAPAQAREAFRTAVDQIERSASGLAVEERRAAFLADKWEVYADLALVERSHGGAAAAFEVSERLRARQTLDLLARGRVSGDGSSDVTTAREQDLRRRIDELARRISRPDGEPGLRGSPPAEDAAATRETLIRLQAMYAELLLELREARPRYAALVRGDVAPATAVMRALARDEALLEFLVGDSTTVLFVVTADTIQSFDLNVSGRSLAELVDFARAMIARRDAGSRQAWRAPMRLLFRHLLSAADASGLLAGKRHLLIAPHAELHYLPFAALVRESDAEQLLVERFTIEYVPSASVWMRLRERPVSGAGGVLALAPRADALPATGAEVAAIGRSFGAEARVLVGAAASEQAFRTLAPGRGVLHLATYGVLNRQNPLFSFVELGASGGQDGRLEVHELFGMSLNARLVVLSACQTGLGAGAVADVPPGDDWVGLVQGFLHAGASNVLATLWPVEDAATARLMERFYEGHAAGRAEGEALAEAQRAALRSRAGSHPFYWAGFALVRGR